MARHQVLGDTLAEKLNVEYQDVLQGKGGFWVKDHGFWTLAKARQLTGIAATPRPKRAPVTAYGDYATIAAMNGRLSG